MWPRMICLPPLGGCPGVPGLVTIVPGWCGVASLWPGVTWPGLWLTPGEVPDLGLSWTLLAGLEAVATPGPGDNTVRLLAGVPPGLGTWHVAEVWPLLFLVNTTICFWPLLTPFLGVTVRRMGLSEAPARTDLGMLMVCMLWPPSAPVMGTWMEIRSGLPEPGLAGETLGTLTLIPCLGLTGSWPAWWGGWPAAGCCRGIGFRFWSKGFIPAFFTGGLRTWAGGRSETGNGFCGNKDGLLSSTDFLSLLDNPAMALCFSSWLRLKICLLSTLVMGSILFCFPGSLTFGRLFLAPPYIFLLSACTDKGSLSESFDSVEADSAASFSTRDKSLILLFSSANNNSRVIGVDNKLKLCGSIARVSIFSDKDDSSSSGVADNLLTSSPASMKNLSSSLLLSVLSRNTDALSTRRWEESLEFDIL